MADESQAFVQYPNLLALNLDKYRRRLDLIIVQLLKLIFTVKPADCDSLKEHCEEQ